MLTTIIKSVAVALLQVTWGRIAEWMRKREYERAKARAAELEGLAASKTEAEKEEAEYLQITAEAQKEKAKVDTAKKKLDWIRRFNNRDAGEGDA